MDITKYNISYLNSSDMNDAYAYERNGALSEACWVSRNAIFENHRSKAASKFLQRCVNSLLPKEILRNENIPYTHENNKTVARRIFIGGTGRSGTSLVRRLLGTHPDVTSIPGETKCINDPTFRLFPHWFHALGRNERKNALKTAKKLWRERFFCYHHSHKASPTDDLRRGLCLWLDEEVLEEKLPRLDALLETRSLMDVEGVWGGFFALLLDQRPRQVGKRFWVEKTPRNSYFADYLYSILPDMKIVNMVRDGRDVALSMRNVSWGEKNLLVAMEWWARELEHTEKVLSGLPNHCKLTVRYEDLVDSPISTLDRICEFLKIVPAIKPDVHGASVGRWEREMEPDIQIEAARKYGKMLSAYGYDPTPSEKRVHCVFHPKAYDMKKRDDGVRYMADLVLPLAQELPCLHMRKVTENAAPCFFLRHDVDNNMAAALHMAHLEHANGVRASYFLLPPSPSTGTNNYYGTLSNGSLHIAQDLLDHARTLQNLGHEVGLHNNFAEVAAYLKCDLEDFIHEQLKLFRDAGIEIHGTSAHGSPFFHQNAFISYEIFAKPKAKPRTKKNRFVTINNRPLRLPSFDMSDFGLHYEAYSLPYDIGITDSNSIWGGKLVREYSGPQNSGLIEEKGTKMFKTMILKALQQKNWRILQVLIHPEHWAIS